MTDKLLEIVVLCSKPPVCRRCGASAQVEDGRRGDYTAEIRAVCPQCGHASGWHEYSRYIHSVVEMGGVLRAVYADFVQRGARDDC